MNKLRVDVANCPYDVIVGNNLLDDVCKYFNLDRKVLIVTDSGVPSDYAKKVSKYAKNSRIVTIEQGEQSKCFDCAQLLFKQMLDFGMDRKDCVVAVGGGVVGDLSGFVASTYMRGIDFYNIPTTLLAQVDSSVGGKTAIDFNGVKNVIGSFYQPKGVLIDTSVLKTLPERLVVNGLYESIKMAMTCDLQLFEKFEKLSFVQIKEQMAEIITQSLDIKRNVVEQDEKESGLRRVLNFGHTLGHAIESQNVGKLYHGECVALGMLAICSGEIRERLQKVLEKLGTPTDFAFDSNKAIELIKKDKKMDSNYINVVRVDKIGQFVIEKTSVEGFVESINLV